MELLPEGSSLPITILSLVLVVACNAPEEGDTTGSCLIDCAINDDMKKRLDKAEAEATAQRLEAERYQEMYKRAIHLDTNNERCNDLRRFLIDQLPQDYPPPSSDTGYLFRFSVHAFFGKCLVRDSKHDRVYAITAENIDTAMFLDKNHDLRILPMETP